MTLNTIFRNAAACVWRRGNVWRWRWCRSCPEVKFIIHILQYDMNCLPAFALCTLGQPLIRAGCQRSANGSCTRNIPSRSSSTDPKESPQVCKCCHLLACLQSMCVLYKCHAESFVCSRRRLWLAVFFLSFSQKKRRREERMRGEEGKRRGEEHKTRRREAWVREISHTVFKCGKRWWWCPYVGMDVHVSK